MKKSRRRTVMVYMFIASISVPDRGNMQIRCMKGIEARSNNGLMPIPVTRFTVREPVILQAVPSDW